MSKKPSPSKPSSAKGAPDPDAVEIHVGPGEDADVKAAKALTGPYVTNAFAIKLFAKGTTGEILAPNIVTALREASERVHKNDMSDIEAMLTSQAMALMQCSETFRADRPATLSEATSRPVSDTSKWR